MATIADGVSAGFKQKTKADKKMITDNLVKYIVGENNTSHKVGPSPATKYISLYNIISIVFRNMPTDICSLCF